MKYLDLLKHIETSSKQAKVVVVSKYHTWNECEPIYQAGCRNFGESRVQDALPKMSEAPQDIDWHWIGSLQKNKVSKIIDKVSLIHSVDSLELAEKISQLSVDRTTPILLQVNLNHKNGFTEEELLTHFQRLSDLKNISIQGLMTMAPHTDNQNEIRKVFSKAYQLKEKLGLKELSMGMSNDFEIAIEEGATILRIGTLVFPN